MKRVNHQTFRPVPRLAPTICVLVLLATTSASAQTTEWLQNDSYTGEPVGCDLSIQEEDVQMAAKFTAPPDKYPYSIERIRVLCCGSSVGFYAVQVWQDDGATPNPGVSLWSGLDAFSIGGASSPTFYDIVLPSPLPVVTSGSIRVALQTIVPGTGFGFDAAITPHRNFVFRDGTWRFAESENVGGDWIIRLGIIGPPTGVGDGPAPRTFALAANVPNPFNPVTTIHYAVAAGGANVEIAIYNIEGRWVRTLVNEHRDAGNWSATWNGEDARGGRVASGVYFYRMRAGSFVETRKMVLLK